MGHFDCLGPLVSSDTINAADGEEGGDAIDRQEDGRGRGKDGGHSLGHGELTEDWLNMLSSDSDGRASHDFGSSKIRALARRICYDEFGRIGGLRKHG